MHSSLRKEAQIEQRTSLQNQSFFVSVVNDYMIYDTLFLQSFEASHVIHSKESSTSPPLGRVKMLGMIVRERIFYELMLGLLFLLLIFDVTDIFCCII